jgi:hypothetical protein
VGSDFLRQLVNSRAAAGDPSHTKTGAIDVAVFNVNWIRQSWRLLRKQKATLALRVRVPTLAWQALPHAPDSA